MASNKEVSIMNVRITVKTRIRSIWIAVDTSFSFARWIWL
jgi:hypothetical protein